MRLDKSWYLMTTPALRCPPHVLDQHAVDDARCGGGASLSLNQMACHV